MKKCLLLALLVFTLLHLPGQYVVDISKVGHSISPTMWGLFYEDINRSGDGGLYADLVKNRSFDFPSAFMGWTTYPSRNSYARNDIFQIIHQSSTLPNNPKYLQVWVTQSDSPWIVNEGFGGVYVKRDVPYYCILRYRQQSPGLKLRVSLINQAGAPVATRLFEPASSSTNWTTDTVSLLPTDSNGKGALVIRFEGRGKLDIDRISLFPSDTWKERPAGLRADLVQKLYDIRPGFLRFPGGCIVEGADLLTRYQWKKTIGPLEERTLNKNQWSDGARPLPDYFQSYGLGFFEYFQLCEDIGAEPMPIINAGLSCQFGAGEVANTDQMDPFIQDALDLIQFSNGAVTTTWGSKRAQMGHPAPFKMKLLGIGNENWGPQYLERLQLFTKAIKEKYPDIQLVTSTGYSPNPQFRYMDSVLRTMRVDIIDEHYYQSPNWFLMNAAKYDHYDRKGPKILLGEYAAHSQRIGSQENKNTLLCGLAEAAFMTGLERNADIVTMAAYAPLFAHVTNWQWTPNLIWFDNLSSYGTPSYYVQKMFGNNKGTNVVPMTINNGPVTGQDSVWASAVIDKTSGEVIIKLVNPSSHTLHKSIQLVGAKTENGKADITILKGEALTDLNTIERPLRIKPMQSEVPVTKGKVNLSIAPYSFTVVKISR